MMNRRCRRCYSMNYNPHCKKPEMIEDVCDNVEQYPMVNMQNECECGFDDEEMDVFPKNPMLAQSYVPIQYIEKTFKPCVGLDKGTIFPELVSPYEPGDSMRDIEYIKNTNNIGEGCNFDGRR